MVNTPYLPTRVHPMVRQIFHGVILLIAPRIQDLLSKLGNLVGVGFLRNFLKKES
jgi:hypothetical protein